MMETKRVCAIFEYRQVIEHYFLIINFLKKTFSHIIVSLGFYSLFTLDDICLSLSLSLFSSFSF